MPQACGVGRGDRRTPTDRVRTRRRRRSVQSPTAEAIKLRPSDWCPAAEAINPNRQTGVQRQKRTTPTVRLVSSGRSDQPQPPNWCPAAEANNSNRQTGVQREKGLSLQPPDWCPAAEAINPNRQTGVQRQKRTTPTVRLVSSGRRAYHSNRRTCAANEGLITPSIGPCCLRRA